MTDITQLAHSKIGASSYSRWSKIHGGCPGSVNLSKGLVSPESAYAAEGTQAHLVAGEQLEKYFFMKIPKTGFAKTTGKEMDDAIKVYIDFVKSQAKVAKASAKDGHILIEHKFNLESVYPGLFGTGDAVIYFPELKKLQVIDYKHGAGIAVEVEDSLQLQYYGLGALISTNFPCDEVELVIVQPRCAHEDGPIRKWSFKAMDLLDFAADLAEDAAATEDPNAPLNPGKHCRFCPAAPMKCPVVRDKAQALAKLEFKPELSYDPEQLAMVLKNLPAIEAWVKKVHEFAYAEAIHGRLPPGWKMVAKRATRKWKATEEEVVKYMTEATQKPKEEFYSTPSLKTPAAMEKLCSKQIGMGLREMIESVSSGYNLAPESDKREAVKLDPSADFTMITEGDE